LVSAVSAPVLRIFAGNVPARLILSCVQVGSFQDSFKDGTGAFTLTQFGRTLFRVRPIARRCRHLAGGRRRSAIASHEVARLGALEACFLDKS
jgi:hypothetical protein